MYPALSVLKQLMSQKPETGSPVQAGASHSTDLQVLWVGGEGGMEADLVKREGIRFESIPAAGVHGVGATALPGNLWRLSHGLLAARRILRKFQPEVVFFTGGFVAVPMALAARLSRRPRSLLYVPDIEPGLALKTIARFSDRLTLTVEDSKAYFPQQSQAVVTGYPLRAGLDAWSNEKARAFFALQSDLPVLLVIGGSKGARSINMAVLKILPELLSDLQVIHITGKLDWPMIEQAREKLSEMQRSRYRPYPYLYEEIGAAMRLASLAVTRAGASSLGELPLFGLPAILVPYPYAWRYQRVNASYLMKRGAAMMLEDGRLEEMLLTTVRELMADKERLGQMSAAMGALAKPEAAARIAAELVQLAGNVRNEYGNNPSA